MTFRKLLMLGGAVAVMMTGASQMANADSDTITTEAVIVTTLDIDCSAGELNFGAIDAGPGGTVTVATDGSVSAVGPTPIPTSGASQGDCALTGEPAYDYQISIAASTVTGPGPAMAVNNILITDGATETASPYSATFGAGGSETISIGADLVVDTAANQTVGTYNGTLTVTAVYN